MTWASRFVLALGAVSLVTIVPKIAEAADWLPLAVGTRWEYQGVGGSHQVETIARQLTVRGRAVAAKSYAEGADAGLENYWLLDTDGSVLLAGFLRAEGFGLAYEPPIRMLPVPPVVGPQPAIHVTAYELGTETVYATLDIAYEVVEDVTLSLPAGSFHAFGVGQVLAPAVPGLAKGRSLTLDGRTLPQAPPSVVPVQPTDWFSEGVGIVQYQSSDLFQLASSNLPTAVAHSTWARVKRLYR